MSLPLLLYDYLYHFSSLPSLSLFLPLSMSLSLFFSFSPPFCPRGWEGTNRISGRWCSMAATACNIFTAELMGQDARTLQGFTLQLRNYPAIIYSRDLQFHFRRGRFQRQVVALHFSSLSSSSSLPQVPLALYQG